MCMPPTTLTLTTSWMKLERWLSQLFSAHAKDNTIVYITIFGNCFELGDLWP